MSREPPNVGGGELGFDAAFDARRAVQAVAFLEPQHRQVELGAPSLAAFFLAVFPHFHFNPPQDIS
jgi:hypothetical protein